MPVVAHAETMRLGEMAGAPVVYPGHGSSKLRTMSTGSLSLAQIANLLTVLQVRCTKCDRRGRYRMATLIERYGADFAGPDLRDKLSVNCEKHDAAELRLGG